MTAAHNVRIATDCQFEKSRCGKVEVTELLVEVDKQHRVIGHRCVSETRCCASARDGVMAYSLAWWTKPEHLEAAREFIHNFNQAAWEAIPYTVRCGTSYIEKFEAEEKAIEQAKDLWCYYSHQIEVVNADGVRIWPTDGSFARAQALRESCQDALISMTVQP